MGMVFKVKRSFLTFDPGDMVTQADAPTADFDWLLKTGGIEPVNAGGVPLMGVNPDPARLMDEVEELTFATEPLMRENAELRHLNAGLHQAVAGALKLAQDRGAGQLAAVEHNGACLAQCAEALKGKAEAEAECERLRQELAAERASKAAPEPTTAPPAKPKK